MGISDKILRDKVSSVISKLEHPGETECPAHADLAEGVKVLLEIQRAILDGKVAPESNSVRIGNVTITGGFAICVAGLCYVMMKIHGVF